MQGLSLGFAHNDQWLRIKCVYNLRASFSPLPAAIISKPLWSMETPTLVWGCKAVMAT